MLQRLLAILLMPFFLVGNSFAHSNCAPLQSSAETARAHIHLGSGWHHHHHDGHSHADHGHRRHSHGGRSSQDSSDSIPLVASQAAATDHHDSDAIYLASGEYWFSIAKQVSKELDSIGIVKFFEAHSATIEPPCRQPLHQQARASARPIFLLHAALRL